MTRPDILLLILDTQRADRLGCYGHRTAITPNLDSFSGEAALFEQAISPAQWTIPSHASMFTGLYPTAHQMTQCRQSLSPDVPHLAEVLSAIGYQTLGFSNNPLVGVLKNGLTRGFDAFYNYGGVMPGLLRPPTHLPWPLKPIAEVSARFLRRISYPIQDFVSQSEMAFRISLNAWLAPFWTRLANFKGQNEHSVNDICHFLKQRERTRGKRPLFLFVNLMETHMPFWPPCEFVDKVAPYLRTSKEARAIMRTWNRETCRWSAPLDRPLGELEHRVLSDAYDAEVSYQDDYLGRLFVALAERDNRENTLTIISSDHGEGLGEHSYVGHSFVAYQELVHVPLIMHWPAQIAAGRVSIPVSTRRIFHTILNATGSLPSTVLGLALAEIDVLTLRETLNGRDPEEGTAYVEVYPPLDIVRKMRRHQPELIEPFGCLSLRRAIVKDNLKMIQIDEEPEELFNLETDPLELLNIFSESKATGENMNQQLKRMVDQLNRQRENLTTGAKLDLESDQQLMQRLRSLGYIE